MASGVKPSLKTIQIASRCSADWNSMTGDDRQRFCSHCGRNVYDLSAMTQREADRLLLSTDGQICARLFRRADGTVLTEDCPVGWNALRRRVSRVAGATLSTALTLYGSAFAQSAAGPVPQDEQKSAEGRPAKSARGLAVIVTDPSGAALPGARANLMSVTTGIEFKGRADESGTFRVADLPIDVYKLSVEQTGFKGFVKDNLVIAANRELTVTLVLGIGTMGGH